MTVELTLKTPTLDDIRFIQWLWSDPETMRPVGGPIPLDDQQARKWFKEKISPGSPSDNYCLIVNQDNTNAGEISFHRLDPESMTADFNVKVAFQHRGNGYAKQAMLLFLDTFFNEMGGQVMQDRVARTNTIGKNLLLDFGFILEPSFEDVFFLQLIKERFNQLYKSPEKSFQSNP